eukprot:m.714341 g.714341  ORF g.714341 m.714341 type:complete len:115 (+) comp58783_c0_seq46:33-377(+)
MLPPRDAFSPCCQTPKRGACELKYLMLEEDSHQLDMPPVDSVKEWAHLILVEHIHSRALLEEFLRNFHTIREARNQQRCEFVVVSHFHRCLQSVERKQLTKGHEIFSRLESRIV